MRVIALVSLALALAASSMPLPAGDAVANAVNQVLNGSPVAAGAGALPVGSLPGLDKVESAAANTGSPSNALTPGNLGSRAVGSGVPDAGGIGSVAGAVGGAGGVDKLASGIAGSAKGAASGAAGKLTGALGGGAIGGGDIASRSEGVTLPVNLPINIPANSLGASNALGGIGSDA